MAVVVAVAAVGNTMRLKPASFAELGNNLLRTIEVGVDIRLAEFKRNTHTGIPSENIISNSIEPKLNKSFSAQKLDRKLFLK